MSDIKNKNVAIYIDQSAAERALVNLQAQADRLSIKIDAGRLAGKNMVAQLAKLETINAKIQGVKDQLDKGLSPTLTQQTNQVRALRNELGRLSASDPAFNEKLEEYRKQNAALAEMKANIAGVQKSNEELGGSFGRIVTRLLEYGAAFFAFEKIKEFFSGSIEEANKAEAAFTRLMNVLENIGRLDVFARLKEKAEELSNEFGTFKADEVIEVFQQLVTYGKLTENQINNLTPVIIDFSAKQRISLTEATSIFTKALEGNSKGLKEYGINISDGATVTERLGILMDQIKPKVEGAAKAFGETTAGQMKKTETEIAELKEEIGTELQPALKFLYQSLADGLKGIPQIFETLSNGFSNFIGGIKIQANTAAHLITGGPAAALDYLAQVNADINKQKQDAKDVADIANAQSFAQKVAADNSKLKLAQQEELLKANIALAQSSLAAYRAVVAAGKENTEDGRKAALQLVQDQAIVEAMRGSIAAQKDKRVLGTGDPDADKAKYNEMLAAAKDFNSSAEALRNEGLIAAESADDKEIAQFEEKYKKKIDKFYDLVKKFPGIKLTYDATSLQNDEAAGIANLVKKQAKQLADDTYKAEAEERKKNYTDALAENNNHFARLKEQAAQNFTDGLIDYKTYQTQVTGYDDAAKKTQLEIDKQYSVDVKEAAAAVTKDQKDQLDVQVKNMVASYEQIKKALEDFAAFDKDTRKKMDDAALATSIGNPQKQYEAQKQALEDNYNNTIDALKKRHDALVLEANGDADQIAKIDANSYDEQLAAQAQFNQASADLDRQRTLSQITEVLNYTQQAISILTQFADAATANENRQLEVELKANDKKKQALQRQLNGKLLTQQEYQRQVNALDAAAEKKKQDLDKKQFERSKSLQIAQALINGAMGVTAVLAARPGPLDLLSAGVARAINIALVVATTAAQIAVIASQKPAFAEGGKVVPLSDGKITNPGNIPVRPNGDNILATVKTGEVILNEEQQRRLGGPATFRAINVPGFAGGGFTGPRYLTQGYVPVNFAAITRSQQIARAYAAGGIVAAGQQAPPPQVVVKHDEETKQLMEAVLQGLQNINTSLKNPVSPQVNFSLTAFQLAQDLKTRILDDAGFK